MTLNKPQKQPHFEPRRGVKGGKRAKINKLGPAARFLLIFGPIHIQIGQNAKQRQGQLSWKQQHEVVYASVSQAEKTLFIYPPTTP